MASPMVGAAAPPDTPTTGHDLVQVVCRPGHPPDPACHGVVSTDTGLDAPVGYPGAKPVLLMSWMKVGDGMSVLDGIAALDGMQVVDEDEDDDDDVGLCPLRTGFTHHAGATTASGVHRPERPADKNIVVKSLRPVPAGTDGVLGQPMASPLLLSRGRPQQREEETSTTPNPHFQPCPVPAAFGVPVPWVHGCQGKPKVGSPFGMQPGERKWWQQVAKLGSKGSGWCRKERRKKKFSLP